MNLFFRIILTVYAFCLAIISAIVMIVTINTEYFFSISNFLNDKVFSSVQQAPRIIMFIIALIFFALSITFLLSGVKVNKDKKAVSKHTNIGEVKISLNSIENIALNTSRKINGVRDIKAMVKSHEDSVYITIKVVVMPEINIPAVSLDIQSKVKKSVEESSGIEVKDVKIVVDNIYTGVTYKARVE